ncbi:ENR1 protein, partial [Chunga burmeisteri]|nr:ENR1 protein [Chunga burmeisteri]
RELELPSIDKNLLISLAERLAGELNVTNCWVCGGHLMTEEWPWKRTGIVPYEILKWNHTITSKEGRRPQEWVLSSPTIGTECLKLEG